MKKTKKRILGLLGLILVAAMTTIAILLPEPNVSATDMSSATDVILVRVVGDVPDVQITSPANEATFITPEQSLAFNYENVSDVTVEVDYTNKDDITTSYTIDNFDADYNPGDKTYNINLLGDNYGYGDYLIRVTGDGYNIESVAEDLVEFHFIPVYGEVEDEADDSIYLNLYYDTENENISTIGINIYDEDGNLVEKISSIVVQSPDTKVELPFSKNNLPTGNYSIEIIAYNGSGEELYLPYYADVYYEAELVPVPDTGMMFMGLSVSKADFLIAGVIIFMLVAIFGIVFVAKGRKRER